ncbi:serine/threonine-protein kinase [Streptomyces smyrnaeus]|uniref:serine/threonine-protein kinase n=1 Tax=Streptomyces smyrnaeus TaxID=1387713 RepID=UPI0037A791CB
MEQVQPERVIGGRYRLVEQIGSGGFGRVWKAHDEALGVHVAVKEVRLPQQASSDAEHQERVIRAAREARNAARLRDHPHIVAVHDVVIEDGAPWIVMRLVDGCSLEERLRADGPMPAPLAGETAAALLKALKAAHMAGIVHRDLKPANVMLTDDGQILLADFGIAVHETDTRLTTTGGVIGSAEYMAPERLNGHQDQAAGDLFSLGVTLYEAIEGVSPFRRDTPTATLAAVVLHDPPPMRHAAPVLASLITALLAKNPEDRPTVDSTLAILRAGAPTITAPQSTPPRPPGTQSEPPTPASGVAPATRSARVRRQVAGSVFLLAAFGLTAFGCTMFVTQGGWEGAYSISVASAALVAVFSGLAVMFYRWDHQGSPPLEIVRGYFLPVFIPLAVSWVVWNAFLLA